MAFAIRMNVGVQSSFVYYKLYLFSYRNLQYELTEGKYNSARAYGRKGLYSVGKEKGDITL